jgi:hypothetical protein
MTIASILYAGQPRPLDVHLATVYWYKKDLDKIDNLIDKWDAITKAKLDNYLANRGEMPYSDSMDIGGIENSIKEMARRDLSIDIDFLRHPKFDANPFYSAPKVDQILKDSGKVDFRRLSDQYSEAKYMLNEVVGAYKQHISIQEDYIIKRIQKPTNCHYQQTGPGNISC